MQMAFRSACEPFWPKESIPRGRDAFFDVHVVGSNGSKVALVVYEYQDYKFLGGFANGTKVASICTRDGVTKKYCDEAQLDQFIIQPETDVLYPVGGQNRYAQIQTKSVSLNSTSSEKTSIDSVYLEKAVFPIHKIGYYCVAYAVIQEPEYDVDVDVYLQQPYGKLVGEKYPLWPFYGTLSLLYLLISIFWFGSTAYYWQDILPVQNWIAGVLFILMLDNSFYFGFYDNWNAVGRYSRGLLFMTVLLNAIRNSLSLFCVLILSLGYGVVKPTLGSQMRKCIIMGVALFVSFVLYNTGDQLLRRDSDADFLLALLVILPLSFSMTTVLSWIHKGMHDTLKHLRSRRQSYKISMYQTLQWILIASTVLVIIFIFVSMSTVSSMSEQYFAQNWTSIWFYQEGWMNLLYFLTFCSIAFLWRPTSNNARYGLEELPESNEAAEALEMEDAAISPINDRVTQRQNQRTGNASSDLIYEIASSTDDETDTAKSPISNQSNTQKDQRNVFTLEEENDDQDAMDQLADAEDYEPSSGKLQ
ncbi:hypothetical protein MP228_000352 [Amoeboaphelidium protococcarum]|nr:hypothetical protein MP228_000352 [Amoeboaphelidium protococcarum]